MNGTATITVPADHLPAKAAALLASGGRMHMAYAWYPEPDAIEIRYLISRKLAGSFELWCCRPSGEIASLADVWPLLSWYEREITDLFGVVFDEQPEPNRLVLHEGVSPVMPPLDPRYPADAALLFENGQVHTPEISIPDIQELPFGPIRADVVESAEFIFFYSGEHIIHYQPRLFFKHRGMEKRFEGLPATLGVIMAERVSGVGSFAHALAYCQAVEQAAQCDVPSRAKFLRVLLAELERLYNHLHYLGHLCTTTTLKVGEAQGKLLEERAKQINARLCGSRFLRSLLAPGGLRRDLSPDDDIADAIKVLCKDIVDYVGHLENSESHVDRLMTTGFLSQELAWDQGATGPIERASGLDRDLRRDHPYAAYADVPPEIAIGQDGDAYARAAVRSAEIRASIDVIQRLLVTLPGGPIKSECIAPPLSEGLGWTESPRGSLFYAVHFGRNGRLARVKIKSPSFSNWRAFPFTVHDSNMMDYAINEASFGLTVAGCDR